MSCYEEQSTCLPVILPATCITLYPVLLDNAGRQEVCSPMSCPEQAQSWEQTKLLRVLLYEGWKTAWEGDSKIFCIVFPLPTCSGNILLSPVSLIAWLTLLPGLCLLETELHIAPAQLHEDQFGPSGPGPSAWDIRTRWDIVILFAVTELFRMHWSLLEEKTWRTFSLLIFYMFE